MHGRLPYLAKPKAKARFVARLAKHQRETMTAAVVRILAQGEPTKFAFEGACRHGLRSQLCLEGTAWAAADKFAAAIVGDALRRIGAVRPPWADGQPDAATFHGTERFYCKNCGRPIPNDRGSYGSGMPVRFCSDLCGQAFSPRKIRLSGERVSAAELVARRAALKEQRIEEQTRPCEQCGKPFTSPQALKRFCSLACMGLAQRKPKELKTCEHCGRTFTLRDAGRWERFCSLSCSSKVAQSKTVEQACLNCSAAFHKKPLHKTRFCSDACGDEYASKTMPEFKCERCGVVFRLKPKTWRKKAFRKTPRFCSQTCSNQATWERRKARASGFACEPVAAE